MGPGQDLIHNARGFSTSVASDAVANLNDATGTNATPCARTRPII
jgi:hypothetical protein